MACRVARGSKDSAGTWHVRDFGRGIPTDDLDRIWEPFFTTGRTLGGTGLGLAVVNNLVTDGMRGTVDITSEPGHGTAVHLRFPVHA